VGFLRQWSPKLKCITACAKATSCCISDVPSQWESQNFDLPQLPHFSTDFNETQNQERYPKYDPTCKIWLMWDNGKKVSVRRAFSVTFCLLSFFVYLSTTTGHIRRLITTVYSSQHVFPRKVRPFGGLDDHGLCDSNKPLYKRCAKSMGRRKFRPPQLPRFSTDFNETQNQERYPGYDATCKIWLMWDDGKGVCIGRAFSITFCVLSFLVFLLTPTGHTRRPITTVYGSKRVFPRKVKRKVSIIKNNVWG